VKIAIIHEHLTVFSGAERVLEQLLLLYPEANLFSVCDFLSQPERAFLGAHKPATTFIQKLPAARKRYRNYLPLMPLAIEQLDLSGYDLVISSSHAVAKGVITGPDQLHISYVHSPIRYAWDLQHQYLRESGLNHGLKGWLAKWVLHKLRLWDSRTANGVDFFVANSNFIRRRIWKAYRRESEVIYPPVDISSFTPLYEKDDFYLTASRMVPYKKIDLIVESFARMPDKRLVVIGDGPDMEKIRSKSEANIEFLGYQSFDVLRDYMQRAKAFVFAAEEDFGIVPVEAQACGTPVIAFAKGGVTETVLSFGTAEEPTGLFFEEQTSESLIRAICLYEANREQFCPDACRNNALRFSQERFRKEFTALVDREYTSFRNALRETGRAVHSK